MRIKTIEVLLEFHSPSGSRQSVQLEGIIGQITQGCGRGVTQATEDKSGRGV